MSNSHLNTRARRTIAGLVLSCLAFAASAVIHPSESVATPTNSYAVWSFGGLFVDQYRQWVDGEVRVRFVNGNGDVFGSWTNQQGVNQCPGQTYLRVHPDHPLFDELTKTLLSAGLSQRAVHIWFEGVDGQCYIKGVNVTM